MSEYRDERAGAAPSSNLAIAQTSASSHDAFVNSTKPLAGPVPAVLAGSSLLSSLARLGGSSDAPWRLLMRVALPYWAAVSVVRIVSLSLFTASGAAGPYYDSVGLTPAVRSLHHVLMLIVVLGAYRAALAVGWPAEGRASALVKHAALGLAVALVSRPLFALSMEWVLDVRMHWVRVFIPPSHGVKLWASMGLEFLLPYFFGLAVLATVASTHALQRSELERANLRSAWMQARLRALRMQLNPHFLFNTFNMIATLLDANPQPARARTLVLALSDLYRRTLNAAEREWALLADELALASDYLRILAARFEGRFTYEIRCGEELASEQIPALLLQPLVENAVTHGVADDRQTLRVWIVIEREAEASGSSILRIEVGNETNGALGSSGGSGIGLRNTATRLSACYGARAQLSARASGPGRFVASITIAEPAGACIEAARA